MEKREPADASGARVLVVPRGVLGGPEASFGPVLRFRFPLSIFLDLLGFSAKRALSPTSPTRATVLEP